MRFGGLKQLAELDGRPLLGHVLAAASEGGLDKLVVVLGADSESVVAGVDLHGAETMVCRSWAEGQSASLACGLAAVADADAAVVLLGDQPRVSAEAIRRVLGARGGPAAVRATYRGRPGHPVAAGAVAVRAPARRDGGRGRAQPAPERRGARRRV